MTDEYSLHVALPMVLGDYRVIVTDSVRALLAEPLALILADERHLKKLQCLKRAGRMADIPIIALTCKPLAAHSDDGNEGPISALTDVNRLARLVRQAVQSTEDYRKEAIYANEH
jgi:hypothetical protein